MSKFSIKNSMKVLLPTETREALKRKNFEMRVKLDHLCFGDRYPYRYFNDIRQIIFVHIPKNAGTSVLMLLNHGKKIPQEHATYWEYLKADYKRYKHYYKFAIVRNPWDRLLSAYKYLQEGGNKGTDLSFCKQLNLEVKDFKQFVCEWLDYDKIYTVKVLTPQYIYIYDQNNKLMVDHLICYENLTEEFNAMTRVLKIDGKLPHINSSKRGNYIDYYDEEMIERVNTFYQKDITLLSYTYKGDT